MGESDRLAAYPYMQKRLHKYKQDIKNLQQRRITDRSREIIAVIARYRFLPTSLIKCLVSGNTRITERHLQTLYHKSYINRFSFPRIGNPTEFIYYLDDTNALDLLVAAGASRESLDYDLVRRNKEKTYHTINFGADISDEQGKLMHLHHELMISRFHFMLELGCRASKGKVELSHWQQGSSLWNKVEVPKYHIEVMKDGSDRFPVCVEHDVTEWLPHRPDAFFTLRFPQEAEGRQYGHFFYEADRKNTSTSKHNKKLRAHFHYIVKQKKHRDDYNIKRVRVLVESTKDHWTDELRRAARHPVVSGNAPSPLFWFTTSEIFTKPREVQQYGRVQTVPLFLLKPEIIFNRIWLTPKDSDQPLPEHFKSLLD